MSYRITTLVLALLAGIVLAAAPTTKARSERLMDVFSAEHNAILADCSERLTVHEEDEVACVEMPGNTDLARSTAHLFISRYNDLRWLSPWNRVEGETTYWRVLRWGDDPLIGPLIFSVSELGPRWSLVAIHVVPGWEER